MGNVLRVDKKRIIEGLFSLGWPNRQIHRETGVHRDTIAKCRLAFQNRPQVPADFFAEKGLSGPQVPADPSPPFPLPRNPLLLPFVPSIKLKFTQGLTAQRIYQDLIEENDYTGSYDSIKRYLRRVKKKTPHFFERLPVFPGREAQVDFSQGPLIDKGTVKKRCWLFKMTLSFSRHAYEELVFSQNVETFLLCHERAFRFFGGTPMTVKLDNLKSGVLRAHLFEPILNPVYLSFSDHWGFVPNPCDPYQPQQKGRVERDIGYTKSNALKGREVKSLEEGNRLLFHWNKRWARTRIHGTTKRQVWQQFVDVEKPCLKPLREKPFPLFKTGERKVDVQGHIEVGGNFYSVPYQLIGSRVKIHFNAEDIEVYQGDALVCVHATKAGKALATSDPFHRPPHKMASLEAEENLHLFRAKVVGHSFLRLIEKLLLKHEPATIKRVRGMMSLSKTFNHLIVNEAAGIALSRYNTGYHLVKALCESIRDGETIKEDALLIEHEHIRSLSEYQTHVQERMF